MPHTFQIKQKKYFNTTDALLEIEVKVENERKKK